VLVLDDLADADDGDLDRAHDAAFLRKSGSPGAAAKGALAVVPGLAAMDSSKTTPGPVRI
jgi:hypothetical protein